MNQDLKSIIRQEYINCAKDPGHFMKKYCHIQHPQRGRVIFNLYPFQEKVLNLFKDNPYSIILKSRQLGISTLSAGYSLWLMLFHKDKNILCIATKQDTAKNMVTKVKFMYDNLPSWLKIDHEENNKLTLRLNNGSQIKATSASSDAGRSEAVSLLIIDEAAFIDGINEIWASAQQTLSTGGGAIVLSCVTDDTYIRTNNGIKQLKDFIDYSKLDGEGYKIKPYEVFGYKKLRSGNLIKNNGEVKTYIFHTGFSKPLECSFNHKLWVYDSKEKKYDWKEAQFINENDYLSLNVGGDIWGDNDSLEDFNKNLITNNLKKEYTYDFHKINKDLAYLIGLYISEGSAYINKTGSGNINISMSEHIFLKDLYSTLNLKYTSSIENNVNTKLSSKYLLELFKYLGFDLKAKAPQKIIPTRVMEFSRDNIISLLQGIFDGDGSINKKGRITLGSSSKELIHQVNLLLNNLGIVSYFYTRDKECLNLIDNKRNIKHTCDFHYLEISERESLKYKEIIGFRLDRKKERLKNIRENLRNTYDYLPDSKEIFSFLVKDVCKKRLNISREKLKNEYKIYSSKILFDPNYKGNISREVLLKLFNITFDVLNHEEIEEIQKFLSPNIRWIKCSQIEESLNKTYDFSLPDNGEFWDHSIIYNNLLGHQTPYGTGNWFHKMWVSAENKENDFLPIRLPWYVHPERDEAWRKRQDELLGDPRIAAQECDCNFSTSGDTVFHNEWIEFIEETTIQDPVERRGVDQNLWIWEPADYSREYMVIADVARGDGKDFSACHVMDIQTNTQVAEYRGQLPPKEFGYFLTGLATEYNNALLVVENANVGWATLDAIIERGYRNLYQSPKSDQLTVDSYLRVFENNSEMVPGFTMSMKTRPLCINKFREFVGDRSVTIHSKRLIEEMKVFVWKNGRPEAQSGYNDDLVMAFGIGMFLRDTSLKFQQQSLDSTRAALGAIKSNKVNYKGGYSQNGIDNPYSMDIGDKKENINWLL